MITLKQRGNFRRLKNYFDKSLRNIDVRTLDYYGRQGVDALSRATPIDTGLTSKSWYYDIANKDGKVSISFYNSNVQDGVSIAIILQYGHGTRNGGWVEGRDYINPAIQPLFDEIANNAWKEVIKT